jgi:hypothetical protein
VLFFGNFRTRVNVIVTTMDGLAHARAGVVLRVLPVWRAQLRGPLGIRMASMHRLRRDEAITHHTCWMRMMKIAAGTENLLPAAEVASVV